VVTFLDECQHVVTFLDECQHVVTFLDECQHVVTIRLSDCYDFHTSHTYIHTYIHTYGHINTHGYRTHHLFQYTILHARARAHKHTRTRAHTNILHTCVRICGSTQTPAARHKHASIHEHAHRQPFRDSLIRKQTHGHIDRHAPATAESWPSRCTISRPEFVSQMRTIVSVAAETRMPLPACVCTQIYMYVYEPCRYAYMYTCISHTLHAADQPRLYIHNRVHTLVHTQTHAFTPVHTLSTPLHPTHKLGSHTDRIPYKYTNAHLDTPHAPPLLFHDGSLQSEQARAAVYIPPLDQSIVRACPQHRAVVGLRRQPAHVPHVSHQGLFVAVCACLRF
jgi:hypothetical protein